jgi:hypothetical protein
MMIGPAGLVAPSDAEQAFAQVNFPRSRNSHTNSDALRPTGLSREHRRLVTRNQNRLGDVAAAAMRGDRTRRGRAQLGEYPGIEQRHHRAEGSQIEGHRGVNTEVGIRESVSADDR